MKRLLLPPYFHPTTACFVDDHESFLTSIDLQLPNGDAFRMFADPHEALSYLNTPHPLTPLVERCFSATREGGGKRIHLDLSVIEQEIKHPERFSRTSVAFIDFSMPTLNGLELCAQLEDPFLKKALLTGVADEKTAVAAFNEGLIDRFISKHSTLGSRELEQGFQDLEQEYFKAHLTRLELALAADPPAFLTDPVVAAFFQRVLQSERLVEYYLVDDPAGFLCLRGDGSMVRVIVHNAEQQAASAAYAAHHGAPNEIVNRLQQRQSVAAFLDSPEHYSVDDPYPWSEYLVPALVVAGNSPWYVGILQDPPTDIDFDRRTASFDAYCRSLGRP